MAITILQLALHRLGLPEDTSQINGAQMELAGLSIMGGCMVCEASLAAYNGYPSKSGYWCCAGCLCDTGWDTVEEANADIFDNEPVPVST